MIKTRAHLLTFFLLAIFTCLHSIAFASDLAKEQRWREQVVDAILDGEAVDLNDGKNDFLAIYTEGENGHKIGLIILHGIGVHPDHPMVVNPLRVGLAEKGWSTLSIQLPVLANEATSEDYAPLIPDAAPRIQAAIDYLKAADYKKIIIVAHSLGTLMASDALAKNKVSVDAFVAIGMGNGADNLKKINIPMLDIYGSQDLENVVRGAAKRRVAADHNKHYTQIRARDADHFFNDKEAALIELVDKWLHSCKLLKVDC
jgi:pimeloyl-ACP methyl ester carboxylesterase